MCRALVVSVVLTVVVLATPEAGAEDTGSIRVKCKPGVSISLDGQPMGVSVKDRDLVIQNVAAGWHKVYGKGSALSQTWAFKLAAGEVREIVLESVAEEPKATEPRPPPEPKPPSGSLLVRSTPPKCRLTIAALGVNNEAKTADPWRRDGLAPGKYAIVADGLGKRLTAKVEVWENGTAEVHFNFPTGLVEDLGAVQLAVERTAAKAAAAAAKAAELKLEAQRAEARKLGIEFPPGWRFVPIPPGKFIMCSGPPSNDWFGKRDQPHEVTLTKAFWMSAYETTQAQYSELTRTHSSHNIGPRRPVETMSWQEAQDFVGRLNERERQAGRLPAGWTYRLPTEAEWEYACRGGSTGRYCYGDRVDLLTQYAWYGDPGENTHEVGAKRPNAYGLYDMHGNAAEWCLDGVTAYTEAPLTDPVGPATGPERIVRGGNAFSGAAGCAAACRRSWNLGAHVSLVGFRLVIAPLP